MNGISIRRFESIASLNESVVALLKHYFEREYPGKHAVMLSGGNTPIEAYRRLTGESCTPASSLHLFFSDERLVPMASPSSNYGNVRFMFEALGVDNDRILRVQSELNPQDAADRYGFELGKLINGGGRITLGLLGLGADGHTASLFCAEDLERGKGRYAIPVTAPNGMSRVSVTPDLLNKAEQIIFVVSGQTKEAVVEKMNEQPASLVAGLAVAGVKMKQLWFAL